MTLLAGKLYLLRRKERDEVEVYDVITYRLRCLHVPGIGVLVSHEFVDMTSCEHYRCVYIADKYGKRVRRLDAQGTFTWWTVNDKPRSLSVNAAHNVIVTCDKVRKIKEFSSHGDFLRELTLPDDIIKPRHAIQTRSGQFVVCHGGRDDPVHRVCVISADGRHIVHSHGGQPGSDTDQYRVPIHLAVDDNEFVFVADRDNRRVTLLSPTLEYVSQVVSRDQLKSEPKKRFLDKLLLDTQKRPTRVCLDTERRLLYVAESDRYYTVGCVEVFSLK